MDDKKLFVGGLPFSMTDQDLQDLFAQHGTVLSAVVIMDRDTRRSKGFGFVEMSSKEEAKTAMTKLNNMDIDGRSIIVNIAKPREERPQGNFNRGGGGGGRNRY